ncbi:hypothetical protein CY35_06G073700 [Sphagnum magellanicum]|nr:hypothetical protein CY35_06G073700 [Sphagnum magellanicum]
MDEDAPISLPQLVQPQAPFSVLPGHPTRAVPESTLEPFLNPFGEQSSFLHTSTLPQVSSPRETGNVPIEWHDLQDEGLGPQQLHDTSGLRIEELPASDSTEDFVATTSSFRPLTDSTTPNIGQFPYVNYEDMDETSIREVSGLTNEENRFHDEMLHAAIEASKREVEIANQRGRGEFMQEGMQVGDNLSLQGAAEEDDIARAISDSLKTAEEEKALRELGEASGPFFMEEIEDTDSGAKQSGYLRDLTGHGQAIVLDNNVPQAGVGVVHGVPLGIHGQQTNESKRIEDRDASILADRRLQEELEDLNENEQPLLRRPLRRSSIIPGSSGLAALPALSVIESLPARLQQSSEHNEDSVSVQNAATSAAATGPTQQNGESFPDEWGGISSEEHDEAIMLEAALFGRPFQLPPSPSVVEQRRLREEQDNAYSESLALDRQKEIIALQEAEALHRKEEVEAAAQHALDYLQQEEQLKLQGAAEELERQLATKRASLPDEPAPEDENAVKLVVRMPDNTRRGRRFHKSDKLQSVFDFIDVLEDVKPGTYRLVMAPRRVFTDKEHESSLQSLGLTSKSLLNFELIA